MISFKLQIITPDRVEFDELVVSVVAPGELGYFGVWANHAPLLSTLQDGKLTIRKTEEDAGMDYHVTGGFLEVHQNTVVILVQAFEPIEAA
jgi:F-type H+-transporting ATPase subunit epsilon